MNGTTKSTKGDPFRLVFSRFDGLFHYSIEPDHQLEWTEELSDRAEQLIFQIVSRVSLAFNAIAAADIPVIVTSAGLRHWYTSNEFALDITEIWFPGSAQEEKCEFQLIATKDQQTLAHLIDVGGVFGVVYPAGITESLWVQLGSDTWDFVICDAARSKLPEEVKSAIASFGLRIVSGDAVSVHTKVDAREYARAIASRGRAIGRFAEDQ